MRPRTTPSVPVPDVAADTEELADEERSWLYSRPSASIGVGTPNHYWIDGSGLVEKFDRMSARLAVLAAAAEEAQRERDEVHAWLVVKFLLEDEEAPTDHTLAEWLDRVFQWGDGAWSVAGGATEKAAAAEARAVAAEAERDAHKQAHAALFKSWERDRAAKEAAEAERVRFQKFNRDQHAYIVELEVVLREIAGLDEPSADRNDDLIYGSIASKKARAALAAAGRGEQT